MVRDTTTRPNTRGTIRDRLALVADFKHAYPDADVLVRHGAKALGEMLELEILTGARRANSED